MEAPMLRTRTISLLLVASSMACASGGNTEVETSWREPGTQPLNFQHVMVSFVTTDEANRRSVEDHLAARIPNGVPAYRAVPNLSITDDAQAREQLRGQNFDG